MMPRLFANVQKLLQLGEFFLLSHRVCSPLFVWVGVRTSQTVQIASQLSGCQIRALDPDPYEWKRGWRTA